MSGEGCAEETRDAYEVGTGGAAHDAALLRIHHSRMRAEAERGHRELRCRKGWLGLRGRRI
ncbi:hypothetical protein GCM10009823_16070 [Brevibacterium salitolerans]|uniref:Transposase DDE domain-containing protein n=1 Tax=Brevibacterium salitolerans TaxID=1403566 RepID=A0ABP5IA50_9MICO